MYKYLRGSASVPTKHLIFFWFLEKTLDLVFSFPNYLQVGESSISFARSLLDPHSSASFPTAFDTRKQSSLIFPLWDWVKPTQNCKVSEIYFQSSWVLFQSFCLPCGLEPWERWYLILSVFCIHNRTLQAATIIIPVLFYLLGTK